MKVSMAHGPCLQERRARNDAAKQAATVALETHSRIHRMDPWAAAVAPSAASAAVNMKRMAEESTRSARSNCVYHAGRGDAARTKGHETKALAGKTAHAVALAEFAVHLDDRPFGTELARRLALALKDGKFIAGKVGEGVELSGQSFYEGVGLSYGGSAMLAVNPSNKVKGNLECVAVEDRVCFSFDSWWVEYVNHQPRQCCATMEVRSPGKHMGPNGLSPMELAPSLLCESLSDKLRWPQQDVFIDFMAARCERSLALLVGSSARGSITRDKINAVLEPDPVVAPLPPLPGSAAYEMERCASAIRKFEKAQATFTDMEQAVRDAQRRRCNGELDPIAANRWLRQLKAAAEGLALDIEDVSLNDLGFVAEPARSLQRDMIRHTRRLIAEADALIALAEGSATSIRP